MNKPKHLNKLRCFVDAKKLFLLLFFTVSLVFSQKQKDSITFYLKNAKGANKFLYLKKAVLLSQFNREDLQTLALRLLAKFSPEVLSEAQQKTFQTHLDSIYKPHNPPHDFRGESHVTPEKALTEIEHLKSHRQLDQEQFALLLEIENYLETKKDLAY